MGALLIGGGSEGGTFDGRVLFTFFSMLLLFVCLMVVMMMGGAWEGKVLSLSVFALLPCVIYTAVYGPTFPIIPLSRFSITYTLLPFQIGLDVAYARSEPFCR